MKVCVGFTLIELVVVILLLGIVALSAQSRWPGRSSFQAQLARDQAGSILRQLQLGAMQFDATSNMAALTPEQRLAVQCRRIEVSEQHFGAPIAVDGVACEMSSARLSTAADGVRFALQGGLDATLPLYFDLLGRPVQMMVQGAVSVCRAEACQFTFSPQQSDTATSALLCLNYEGFIFDC
ncbi:type II secretion system protein [Thaumasiovibrio sp. DFM-14]|uniref:type II secretion system protein n=1 Tax=Thaumasiovibrio sp. DFM-14 TaxID=3384792 RepID=UPI0039A29FF1